MVQRDGPHLLISLLVDKGQLGWKEYGYWKVTDVTPTRQVKELPRVVVQESLNPNVSDAVPWDRSKSQPNINDTQTNGKTGTPTPDGSVSEGMSQTSWSYDDPSYNSMGFTQSFSKDVTSQVPAGGLDSINYTTITSKVSWTEAVDDPNSKYAEQAAGVISAINANDQDVVDAILDHGEHSSPVTGSEGGFGTTTTTSGYRGETGGSSAPPGSVSTGGSYGYA